METEMGVKCLVIASALLAAAPAVAQSDPQTAARNADNWAVFQQLYPARAIAAHEEGAVGFKITIDRSGAVTGCQVTHTSGHPLLDQETCNLITLHAEFKPEEGLSGSQVRTREGVIAWKLPGSSTSLAAPQVMASNDANEKVVCKKTVRTGTLAAFERTCMTQREWARQSDNERETWQEVQGKKGSTSGN
jgi:TonB family protein